MKMIRSCMKGISVRWKEITMDQLQLPSFSHWESNNPEVLN
jgi:hypothetical protein